jgi:hypothetical protein
MPKPKYTPGQRVRINENAIGLVMGFVGMSGLVGIGGITAPSFYQGYYFVTVRMETGDTGTLRLPEQYLDEIPAG